MTGGFLQYKGFFGTVEFCEESKLIHGQIAGIRALCMYDGDSMENLQKDFEAAVDFHIETSDEDDPESQTSETLLRLLGIDIEEPPKTIAV